MREQTMNISGRIKQRRASFRDQAAFVYLTGIMPTHLRTTSSRELVAACEGSKHTTLCGGWLKAFDLKPDVIEALEIPAHPMVRTVETLVDDGWSIKSSRGPNSRRPFTRVFLKREGKRRVVQRDGSILMDWPDGD